MPENVVVYRIFISSPSDVSEERNIVEEVISELNPLLIKLLNISFQPLNWKTSVYPGLSGLGGQGVIDQQIPVDYEVYLGLLWKRFGEPIAGASSGTEHEFKRAFERWEEAPQGIKVMVYFKTSAGDNLADIDPAQLAKVLSFKQDLGKVGLYKEFSTAMQFRTLLRTDLTNLAVELRNKPSSPSKAEPLKMEASAEVDDLFEDEPGLLDLIESGTEAFEKSGDLMSEISQLTTDLGTQTRSHTEQIQNATQQNKGTKELKRIINSSGNLLSSYATELEARTPELSKQMLKALGDYGNSATLLMDFEGDHTEALAKAYESVKNFENTITETYESVSGMRDSIKRMPRATSGFNRGKHAAINAIDNMLLELVRVSELSTTVKATMKKLLASK